MICVFAGNAPGGTEIVAWRSTGLVDGLYQNLYHTASSGSTVQQAQISSADGRNIQASNNNNYSYFNDPKWNKKMERAARLVGPNRLKVYGQMDLDIMKQAAPMAVERTYNNRYIFSNRVNPKSLIYQGIYQDWDWTTMALK